MSGKTAEDDADDYTDPELRARRAEELGKARKTVLGQIEQQRAQE